MASPTSPVRALKAARRRLPRGALGAAVAALALTVAAPGAEAAGVVAPGNFTGMGFDACAAPSSTTMDKWMRAKENPYRAVGVYISGGLRACNQPNLTAAWVSHQTKMGWHIMPLTVGRQAACSGFSKRVSSDPANTYAKARKQARAGANNAVEHAQKLGIAKGSTLFYDMESWHTGYTRCDASTLWFLSTWTNQLHKKGYAGGVYSSASTGITLLDRMATTRPKGFHLPDFIWYAQWNDKANTETSYIKKSHWTRHQRIHQFYGGHIAKNGGVKLNIDSNWLDVRVLGSAGSRTSSTPPSSPPSSPPTATSSPTTPATAPNFRCTRGAITRTAYPATSARSSRALVGALQCLLRNRGYTTAKATGMWNAQTTTALQKFQRKAKLPVSHTATRRVWTALTVDGITGPTLRNGASRPAHAVIALSRSLNAAVGAGLHGTGYFGELTEKAVKRYKRQVFDVRSGVVGAGTWRALRAGRIGSLPSARVAADTSASGPARGSIVERPAATTSPSAPPSSQPSPSVAAPSTPPAASPSASPTTASSSSAPTPSAPPVTKSAADRSVTKAHPGAAAVDPARSSASGIKAPTRKAAPERPAVLRERVPVMHPVSTAPVHRANPMRLLAKQLSQVLVNVDVETSRAVRLFFTWLDG